MDFLVQHSSATRNRRAKPSFDGSLAPFAGLCILGHHIPEDGGRNGNPGDDWRDSGGSFVADRAEPVSRHNHAPWHYGSGGQGIGRSQSE